PRRAPDRLNGAHLRGQARHRSRARTCLAPFRPTVAAFLDPRGFARQAAQVIQLGAADRPAAGHLDLFHARRLEHERALDTHAMAGRGVTRMPKTHANAGHGVTWRAKGVTRMAKTHANAGHGVTWASSQCHNFWARDARPRTGQTKAAQASHRRHTGVKWRHA